MPTPRYLPAVKRVEPTGLGDAVAAADAVTEEVVEGEGPNGTYFIKGVATPHRGGDLSLAVGDVVTVLWRSGSPFMILDYGYHPGAPHDAPAPGACAVEELFLAKDPDTDLLDVWFRNGAGTKCLKLRGTVPDDPKGVKWGVNRRGFYVVTLNDEYFVFEMKRSAKRVQQVPGKVELLYKVNLLTTDAQIGTFRVDYTITGKVQKIQPKRDYDLEAHYTSTLNFSDIGAQVLSSFADGASFGPAGTTLYMDEFVSIRAGVTTGSHRFWDSPGFDSFVYTMHDTENREDLPFGATIKLDLPIRGKDLATYDVVLDQNNDLLVCGVLNYTAVIFGTLARLAQGETGTNDPNPDYVAFANSHSAGFYLGDAYIAAAMTATYSSGAREFFEGEGYGLVDLTDRVASMKARLIILKQAGWSVDSYGFQSPFYRSGEVFQPTVSSPVLWNARTRAVTAGGLLDDPSIKVSSRADFGWFHPILGVGHEHYHDHRASGQPIEWTIEGTPGNFEVVVTQTEGGYVVDNDSDVQNIPFTFNPGGAYPFGASTHYTSGGNGVQSVDFLPNLGALLAAAGVQGEFYHVCGSKLVTRGDITVDDRFFDADSVHLAEGGRIGRALKVQTVVTQTWWGLPVDAQPPPVAGRPHRATHLLIPLDLVSYDKDDVGFCDPLVFKSLSRMALTYTFALLLTDDSMRLVKSLVLDSAPPDPTTHQQVNPHTVELLSASETYVMWSDVSFVEPVDPVRVSIATRLTLNPPTVVAKGQGDALEVGEDNLTVDPLATWLKRRFTLLAPNVMFWPDDQEATRVDTKKGNKFVRWLREGAPALPLAAGPSPPTRGETLLQGALAALKSKGKDVRPLTAFPDAGGISLASARTLRNPSFQVVLDQSALAGRSVDERAG